MNPIPIEDLFCPLCRERIGYTVPWVYSAYAPMQDGHRQPVHGVCERKEQLIDEQQERMTRAGQQPVQTTIDSDRPAQFRLEV